MFGSLFGAKSAESAAHALPLGFRLGGAVAIDDVLFKAHPDAFGFEPPSGNQIIEALGTVDLGGGTHLYRMYVTDDAWIQVKTTSGAVDDIKLFVFSDTVNPPNASAFRQWAEQGSELGQSQVEFNGHSYDRVWGDAPQGAWAPPVVYDETVTHPKDGEADFELTHYSMLYQRELPELPGRYEYLFITAEDYGPDHFDVVYSLGADITVADLSIT